MKTFFKSIDYFSHKFTYTHKGKDKYNTVLGGVATSLALLVILINAWIIGKDIYLREQPIVIGYEEVFNYYPTTKINYDNIFLGFFISDSYNYAFEDESILKIIPSIYANYFDQNGNLKYKERFLELTDCISELERLNLTAPLTPFIMKPIKCIKNLNEILSGFWTDTFLSYLMFKVYRCTNETISEISNLETVEDEMEFRQFEKNISKINLISLNNEDKENDEFIRKLNNIKKNDKNSTKKENKTITCKSIEEIEKVTQNLYFNFLYTSVAINSKNYTEPMITQISQDWFTLGIGIFKTIDYYFQNFIVRTDDGMIFSHSYQDLNKIGYFKHLADSQLLYNSNSNIFWLSIYISNHVKYMTREYIKVQNIFANLGGIIQVVLIFFKIIFYPYFQKKLNLKIINELFDFDDALISGMTDTKVLKRSNIKRIDSLIGSLKLNNSKDNNIIPNSNMKNNSFNLNKNNFNKKSNFIKSDNGIFTNDFALTKNDNYFDKSKLKYMAINNYLNERRISELDPNDYQDKIKFKYDCNVKNDLKINDGKYKNKNESSFPMNQNSNKCKISYLEHASSKNNQFSKYSEKDHKISLPENIDYFNFEDDPKNSNVLLKKIHPQSNSYDDNHHNIYYPNTNLNSKKVNYKLDIKENSIIIYRLNNQYKTNHSFNDINLDFKGHKSTDDKNKHYLTNKYLNNNKPSMPNRLLTENLELCENTKIMVNNEDMIQKKLDDKNSDLKNGYDNNHINLKNKSKKLRKKNKNNTTYKNLKNRTTPHVYIEKSNDKEIKLKDKVFLNLKDNNDKIFIQNNDIDNLVNHNCMYKIFNIQKEINQERKEIQSVNGKNNFIEKNIEKNNEIKYDFTILKNNVIDDKSESKNQLNVNDYYSNLDLLNKNKNYNILNDNQNLCNNNKLENEIEVEYVNNNLFYKKSDIKANNHRRKKKYRLRQDLGNYEFENKVDEVLNTKGRKLNFKNAEIFNGIYCYVCCKSRIFKQKNMLYKYAYENLSQFTDYLESIKNFQDLTKIKYLLFSTEQILSFPYLSNPERKKVGIHHEIQEYARAFGSRICEKETAIEIFNYFHKNIQNETLNTIDKKIWNIFDPKMKNLFISTSNGLIPKESNKNNNIELPHDKN